MRLVEEIVDLVEGQSARGLRFARPEDWYFQGHFPGDPIVPAIVLIELLAQTGGLIAASGNDHEVVGRRLRLAALGPFKFPASARPYQRLDAHARVAARIGRLIKIEGYVLADETRVAIGSVTLADVDSNSAPGEAAKGRE
jgi:3-hydroxyacyl-[acyl-carrier-protein] dehydratase